MLSIASAALSFNGPIVARPMRSMGASMAVEDLVGGINDPIFGGTPEGKIFDPLGLGADEAALYRRRCVEIKHGRVCMVAFLGMTVGPNDVRTARALGAVAQPSCCAGTTCVFRSAAAASLRAASARSGAARQP
jgi:hypothetical protein